MRIRKQKWNGLGDTDYGNSLKLYDLKQLKGDIFYTRLT